MAKRRKNKDCIERVKAIDIPEFERPSNPIKCSSAIAYMSQCHARKLQRIMRIKWSAHTKGQRQFILLVEAGNKAKSKEAVNFTFELNQLCITEEEEKQFYSVVDEVVATEEFEYREYLE